MTEPEDTKRAISRAGAALVSDAVQAVLEAGDPQDGVDFAAGALASAIGSLSVMVPMEQVRRFVEDALAAAEATRSAHRGTLQ